MEKVPAEAHALGSNVGRLTPYWATEIGLSEGIPVAVGNVDSHAAIPACGVTAPGSLAMIMGTSVCHWVLGDRLVAVRGMRHPSNEGVVPGLWGYEGGQSAVGDLFAWFFERAVPNSIRRSARKDNVSFQSLLEKKAAALAPGECGLLALDWWNGNRSVLVDADLNGILLGLTLSTKPEEIFRALIEATAFGTRIIIDAFEKGGFSVGEIVACGGLPAKNKLLMQVYADVCGREIKIARRPQTCSGLGAAMHGAVAAGASGGGYDSISKAARYMAGREESSYKPRLQYSEIYRQLFEDYRQLHDYFGSGQNEVMKRLKRLKLLQETSSQP